MVKPKVKSKPIEVKPAKSTKAKHERSISMQIKLDTRKKPSELQQSTHMPLVPPIAVVTEKTEEQMETSLDAESKNRVSLSDKQKEELLQLRKRNQE